MCFNALCIVLKVVKLFTLNSNEHVVISRLTIKWKVKECTINKLIGGGIGSFKNYLINTKLDSEGGEVSHK